MTTDAFGITDEVEVTLNDEPILSLATDAKGPAALYVQQYETPRGQHTFRVVDRFGEVQSPVRRENFKSRGEATKAAKAAAKGLDGAEHEPYPGASGGPLLLDPEGEPE